MKLIKSLDAIIGKPLCRIISAAKPLGNPRNISRILLIRPGGIGDAVLLLPVIATIKRLRPQAALHILAERRNAGIFALAPEIEATYCYDAAKDSIAVMRNRYDIILDTEQWHRLSAIVAKSLRAPMTIGFATNERKKLFTHAVSYSHEDYEVHSFLRLMQPLVGPVSFAANQPFIALSNQLTEKAGSVLRALSDRRIVAIFAGASIRERKWGADKFHAVAGMLSDQGHGIVVVGGKHDLTEGETITEGVPRSLNLCGKLSLAETAAVLSRSQLLITGDSGIMHIGHGLGMKIVALFGPGREKKWAPQGPNIRVINKKLPCSPCTTFGYTPRCPKDAACMKAIEADEVIREAIALLEPQADVLPGRR